MKALPHVGLERLGMAQRQLPGGLMASGKLKTEPRQED